MQKYSVLMMVYIYDNPDFFAMALDSMLNQTYPADEIVIIKDGPITLELQAVIDERKNGCIEIKEVNLEKNQGRGCARNAGVNACRNELIAIMDSDDYSLPERCALEIEAFERNPYLDIVGGQLVEFEGDIQDVIAKRDVPLEQHEIYKYAKFRDPFNNVTVMFRKSSVQRAGGYSSYRMNEDTDLWIRMLKQNANCVNLKNVVLFFRFDRNTYQRRKSWENTRTLIAIRYNALKSGFNSFFEFLLITITQMGIYMMPKWFTEYIYRIIFRKKIDSCKNEYNDE